MATKKQTNKKDEEIIKNIFILLKKLDDSQVKLSEILKKNER
jgi:hypothetical protein